MNRWSFMKWPPYPLHHVSFFCYDLNLKSVEGGVSLTARKGWANKMSIPIHSPWSWHFMKEETKVWYNWICLKILLDCLKRPKSFFWSQHFHCPLAPFLLFNKIFKLKLWTRTFVKNLFQKINGKKLILQFNFDCSANNYPAYIVNF